MFQTGNPKGYLISKCLFGIFKGYFEFSQNTIKEFDYYGTSSPIVFIHFLGELKTQKWHFEINWPLVVDRSKKDEDLDSANIFFYKWQ